MWILLVEALFREAAAHRVHIFDVLVDEAVEGDHLADDRQAEFDYGGPKLTQLHNRVHFGHLQHCDRDFDGECH